MQRVHASCFLVHLTLAEWQPSHEVLSFRGAPDPVAAEAEVDGAGAFWREGKIIDSMAMLLLDCYCRGSAGY